jgi:hypothetical protein
LTNLNAFEEVGTRSGREPTYTTSAITFCMGYQPGVDRSGRTRGFDKQRKAKTKKAATHRATGRNRGGSGVLTLKEVVERTLAGLDNLGSQTFATPPFRQHFDRWLISLTIVLDDFEVSPGVEVDDRFHRERAELLSATEIALKMEQEREAERDAKILSMHGSKDLLLHTEGEHELKLREFSAKRNEKLKALNSVVDSLRAGLDALYEEKAGFLERFTNSKAQRVAEMESRVSSSESVLESARADFDIEAGKLQREYAERRRVILEKVSEERAAVEKLEAEAQIDGSVEIRRLACEELSLAVKALVERMVKPRPD